MSWQVPRRAAHTTNGTKPRNRRPAAGEAPDPRFAPDQRRPDPLCRHERALGRTHGLRMVLSRSRPLTLASSSVRIFWARPRLRINMRPGCLPARPWPGLPTLRRILDNRAPGRRSERLSVGWCHLCARLYLAYAWRCRNGRRGHDRHSAPAEERHDQREHFAGSPCHANMRCPGEHCELRVRQEFEHLHNVGQR